jgi:hypothetical protein
MIAPLPKLTQLPSCLWFSFDSNRQLRIPSALATLLFRQATLAVRCKRRSGGGISVLAVATTAIHVPVCWHLSPLEVACFRGADPKGALPRWKVLLTTEWTMRSTLHSQGSGLHLSTVALTLSEMHRFSGHDSIDGVFARIGRPSPAAVASANGRPLNERSAAYVQRCFGTSKCFCDGSGASLFRCCSRPGSRAECVRRAAV